MKKLRLKSHRNSSGWGKMGIHFFWTPKLLFFTPLHITQCVYSASLGTVAAVVETDEFI